MKPHKARRSGEKTRTKYLWPVGALFGVLALSLIAYGMRALREEAPVPESTQTSRIGTVEFTDARRQAAVFIAHDRSIVLTPEQKKVMDDALATIPAPCCAQYSIATCCCPCNLAKSTWGLAKLLIIKHRATAAQVKATALEWLQFSNPNGYTGNACFTGGCERSFEHNGCGGMHEDHLT